MANRIFYFIGCLDRLSQEMALSVQPLPQRFAECFRTLVLSEGMIDESPTEMLAELDKWSEHYFGVSWKQLDDEALDDFQSQKLDQTVALVFNELMTLRETALNVLMREGVAA